MKFYRTIICAALALPALLAIPAFCQPAPDRGPAPAGAKAELVIGVREFLSDLPAMIAAADGLYALEGAKVRTVIKKQGKDNKPLLLDGTLDLALVGGHIGHEIFSSDKDSFVILASIGGGGRRWRVMAAEGSGISSLEGLKDKKIGLWPSSYGSDLLVRLLTRRGIRYSSVRVPMDPEQAIGTLKSGKVQALLAWEPIPSMLEDRKLAHEIFTLDGLGAGVPVYLAARKSVVKNDPEGIAGVLRTLDRAIALIRNNPEQAVRRAAATLRLPPRVLKKALRNHEFGLGLTCAQRDALAEAARLSEGNKGAKDKARPGRAIEFYPEPLRAFLQKRAGETTVLLEENCPPSPN